MALMNQLIHQKSGQEKMERECKPNKMLAAILFLLIKERKLRLAVVSPTRRKIEKTMSQGH